MVDEDIKATRFRQGLRHGIHRHLVAQWSKTYQEIVDAAYAFEQDYPMSQKKKVQQGRFEYGKTNNPIKRTLGRRTMKDLVAEGQPQIKTGLPPVTNVAKKAMSDPTVHIETRLEY